MRVETLQSSVRANPSVADRPESAATQTKPPSRWNTDAAAPGVGDDVGVCGTEPVAELVAAGRLIIPVRERWPEEEEVLSGAGAAVVVTMVLEVGCGVSPCGIDICPVADAHGVFV
jgi:hypothetical protein